MTAIVRIERPDIDSVLWENGERLSIREGFQATKLLLEKWFLVYIILPMKSVISCTIETRLLKQNDLLMNYDNEFDILPEDGGIQN